jgi:hypothetical protein
MFSGPLARNGHLLLTNQRLAVYPHLFDRALQGKTWECTVASISNVTSAPRGLNPFDGSLRRLLQVEHDRRPELFVMPHVDAVISAIKRVITDS